MWRVNLCVRSTSGKKGLGEENFFVAEIYHFLVARAALPEERRNFWKRILIRACNVK